MAIKRLHYFNHQFLVEADFTGEQQYHMDMRRRLNRMLHTHGIGDGLEVAKTGNKEVTVRAGSAIDRNGREIILEADQVIDLSNAVQFPANSNVFITIAYQEQESDPSTATGAPGNTRVTELPLVQAVTAAPPTDGSVIRLARITLDGAANVPGNNNDTFDGGVRQTITPRGGLGIASLDGVSNPGGNIDLVPGPGITLAPNDATNQITIGSSALASLDGVSNAGGNIDLVQGGAIEITPSDAANTILISENHSARTDNPHQTTAAQIGAMLAADYDLRRRATATIAFSEADANGATRTINIGFQPRLLIVVGTLSSLLGSRTYGGGMTAFADLGPPISQRCNGFAMTRFSNTDWFIRAFPANAIGSGTFFNSEVAPSQAETLNISVTSVSATGLTATFTRTLVNASAVVLPNFNLSLTALCLGA